MRFGVGLLLAATLLAGQDARGFMNRGVQAFKDGRYVEAVAQFQQAVDLDPSSVAAHQYLATALMRQHILAEPPDNLAMWSRAESEFRRVLELDANNRTALSSLASLNFNARKWDDARRWYKALLNVDPENAEAYYSLAVITWSEWYPEYAKARTDAGMKAADPGPILDAAIRSGLRARYWSSLDDAVWDLNQALSRNPRYGDAMAYMNLIVRERADLRDTKEEYQRDTAEADQWMQKAMEAKKAEVASAPPPTPGGWPTRVKRSYVPTSKLIYRTDPVYPPVAKQARIQGTVRLAAVLDKSGAVKYLQLISGHPLLVDAALDCARQWRYRPMVLDGQPVEVQIQIEVNFVLPGEGGIQPRIRVGSIPQSARLVRQPKPVYPPEAKRAGIQGVVRLSLVIDRQGRVRDLTVVSGHPALVQAAMDAVKQWIYEPTLLNGEPVEVKTMIDVPFTLDQ